MSNQIYEAACEYAQLGLNLVPLNRSNSHSAIRYKHRGGLLGGEFGKWFRDGEHNVGILTGDNSAGLMALDLDDYNALRDFQDRHPKLAKSLPCAASAYGWHFFFHAPEGERAALAPTMSAATASFPSPISRATATISRRHPRIASRGRATMSRIAGTSGSQLISDNFLPSHPRYCFLISHSFNPDVVSPKQ
jgi:hypothetical protein